MQWPADIITAFEAALEIVPTEGYTPGQVLQAILDETARRAVWRAQNDPARARGALRWPFTPLGSVVPSTVGGRAKQMCLKGSEWGRAVDKFHQYIEDNAVAIFEIFRDEAEPYDDLS